MIATQTGSVRQDKKIIEALACSRDTLRKYRGYLLATLVYQEIYPFINNTLHRLVKSPKGYLSNNGLISYLTGIDSLKTLETSGLVEHRLENWFLKELQIALDRSSAYSKIHYWRTTSGSEVDFVVKEKSTVIPFEVSYAKKIQNKKLNNLQNFINSMPSVSSGFYIYMGEFGIVQDIYLIPAWLVC